MKKSNRLRNQLLYRQSRKRLEHKMVGMAESQGFSNSEITFGIEPIRAFRRFVLTSTGHLKSLYFEHVWTHTDNIAVCRRGEKLVSRTYHYGKDGEEITDENDTLDNCNHGFWAYSYWEGDRYSSAGAVIGVVDVYGEVIVGTKGVRGTKADIVAIVLPEHYGTMALRELLQRFLANYPDVIVMKDMESLREQFPLTDPPE